MICPNKICQKEIPNDSIFCDQCGVPLRQCTKCGSITLAKFCTECGGIVVDRKIPENVVPEKVFDKESKPQEEENLGTVIIEKNPVLQIIHSNFSVEINSGDIIGRTTGSHTKYFGQFPVISSKHGKVELLNNEWFFTDLHSSNKSFLNGKVLTPDIPAKLSDNDNLTLANVQFSVSIK